MNAFIKTGPRLLLGHMAASVRASLGVRLQGMGLVIRHREGSEDGGQRMTEGGIGRARR